jgi:hypothetical protein
LSNDLLDLPIIRAQVPSTIRTESNPYVAELESAENNCSSELSDVDSHYFEEFSSAEEQEVYEEEEDVEEEHNSGIMTGGEMGSAQSSSNYAEESTPVLPTNIRSPVETHVPADLLTFDTLVEGGAFGLAPRPLETPSAPEIRPPTEPQVTEPVDLLSQLVQQAAPDNELQSKVASIEPNQILLDPDAIQPKGVPEMHAAPTMEIPVCPPTPSLPGEFTPHDGDAEADVAIKQLYLP